MQIYTTTNIPTPTNPMHAIPHHHRWEISACIGSVVVDIFVGDMTSTSKENYNYKNFNSIMVTKTIRNMTSMQIYTTTNIPTPTNPMHAIPHHHGR